MKGYNIKTYLSYWNELLDECDNTYKGPIGKKPIHADDSALTDVVRLSHKAPKFKVRDRVRITKKKNIFSSGYNENGLKKIFMVDSVLRTNLWTHKIIKKQVIRSFWEKELWLSIFYLGYYSEPNSHVTDKVKVELDLWNYAPKKN